MSAPSHFGLERTRQIALWLCLGLFAVRVIGQIEVVLWSPSWLPPFQAWESGLVPYGVLLPVQIMLIAWMALVAADQWRGSGRFWVTQPATRRRLRIASGVYFAVMLLRLVMTAAIPPHSLTERGLIPVLAHWDLAAFIYLTSRPTPRDASTLIESESPKDNRNSPGARPPSPGGSAPSPRVPACAPLRRVACCRCLSRWWDRT
jgi:hypothetical protein